MIAYTKGNRAAARTAILLLFLAFCMTLRSAPPRTRIVPTVLGERLTGGGGSTAAAAQAKEPKDKTNASAKKAFTIAGDVTGLFPGASTTLQLSIHNLNNFAISVQVITVDVADAGTCPGAVLTVDDFSGALLVAKNGSASTNVAVSMSPDAGPACEDATWPLTYTGTAVKP